MSIRSIRILTVGPITYSTLGTLKRLARAGWGSHTAAGVHEAETVLKTIRFKIVLCAENLPDGTAYELAGLVERQGGTLFMCVALSETCLWLPVVEEGVRSLGRRAMNPSTLEAELDEFLRSPRLGAAAIGAETRQEAVAPGGANQAEPLGFVAAHAMDAGFHGDLRRDISDRPTRKMARAMFRTAIAHRRKSADHGTIGVRSFETVTTSQAKPMTGTHGKGLRG